MDTVYDVSSISRINALRSKGISSHVAFKSKCVIRWGGGGGGGGGVRDILDILGLIYSVLESLTRPKMNKSKTQRPSQLDPDFSL